MGAPIHKGKMKAKHILIDKYTKAQEIYEKVLNGASFEQMARQHSTCTSRNKGGSIGQFSRNKVVKEFWNACKNLNINEISEPVKSQFGYHIIKRTD